MLRFFNDACKAVALCSILGLMVTAPWAADHFLTATYSLILIVEGEEFTVDTGLSYDDCVMLLERNWADPIFCYLEG